MDPQLVEIDFPLGGIDVSGEFGVQRPGTTPSATNVRAMDPILERNRGGSRHGLVKFGGQVPAGSKVIQDIGFLVDPTADNLAATFGDSQTTDVDDPSTNNLHTRNPSRKIPRFGSGATPARTRPRATYRRVTVSASSTTPTDGDTVTLTSITRNQPANTAVVGGTVTMFTLPPEQDGNGDTGTTGAVGQKAFAVTEPTFEGPISYFVEHKYTPSGAVFQATARGFVTVTWKPNLTVALAPAGGASVPSGTSYTLTATLTNAATGLPVAGRVLRLGTSPAARVGNGVRQTTDGAGQASFVVSDDSAETVSYTATLMGVPPKGATAVVSSTVAITWTGGGPTPPVPGACEVRLFSTSLIAPASPPQFPCAIYQFVYHYFVNGSDGGFYAATSQYSPDGQPISGACLCGGFANATCPFDGLPVTADGTICAETDGDPYSLFLQDECNDDIVNAGCEPQ